MLLALNAGTAAGAISFAGPGKSDAELQAAAASGVLVAIESRAEFQRVADIGARMGQQVPVILRVNPPFQLKHSGLAMGGLASQFGLEVEDARALLASLPHPHVSVRGFHVFAGSQNLLATSVIECQRQTIALATELAGFLPEGMQYLNFGGGFGIPYFPGEQALDIDSVGNALGELIERNRERLAATELVIELGRYIVGEAGYYVTTVVDIKRSRDKVFVVVDGGMNHHLANSGNLGQVIRRNYPVVVANRIGQPAAMTATVVGPLCTPLDVVAADVELPMVEVGDRIAVLQSGAYGRSASPLGFLGRPAPVELLV